MVAYTIPQDGRLTSFQTLNLPLTGGEVMYIVSPGNAALGNSYQVTTLFLAGFFSSFQYANTTIITAGATSASPYMVETTDTRILFNKTLGSASYAVLPLSSSMAVPYPILFKDLKGDAGTNAITISFTGGQLCDGLTSVVLSNAYAWTYIAPVPGGNGWFQC